MALRLLNEMPAEWMIGGLVEEGRFPGGCLQQMLVPPLAGGDLRIDGGTIALWLIAQARFAAAC